MGRLDGFVLRSQLEVLLRRGAYCSVGGDYMSPPPDVAAFEAALNQEMRAAQETVVMQVRACDSRISHGMGDVGLYL